MAHQPVGDTITLTTGTSSTRGQFTVQSDSLRVVPTGNNVHVAIGTTATAATTATNIRGIESNKAPPLTFMISLLFNVFIVNPFYILLTN